MKMLKLVSLRASTVHGLSRWAGYAGPLVGCFVQVPVARSKMSRFAISIWLMFVPPAKETRMSLFFTPKFGTWTTAPSARAGGGK